MMNCQTSGGSSGKRPAPVFSVDGCCWTEPPKAPTLCAVRLAVGTFVEAGYPHPYVVRYNSVQVRENWLLFSMLFSKILSLYNAFKIKSWQTQCRGKLYIFIYIYIYIYIGGGHGTHYIDKKIRRCKQSHLYRHCRIGVYSRL